MYVVPTGLFVALLVTYSCALIRFLACAYLETSSVETHLHLTPSILLEFLLLPSFPV